MKRVYLLIVCALLTGLFEGSVYAGITIEEKLFDPQPEPPGISQTAYPEDSLVTLPDGRKLEFVQRGNNRRVYLILKNGTRKLADGPFTLHSGKQLTIIKGVIVESK